MEGTGTWKEIPFVWNIPLKIHKNTGLNETFAFVLTSLELCVCASVCAFKVD